MKRVFLVLTILLVSFLVQAKGLNSNASYIKKNYPDEYENSLKKHALEKWNDDYEMVVYEINNQADALVELIENFKSDYTNIAFKAIQKWSIDGFINTNITIFKEFKTFGLKELIRLHCDWGMVKYEYENQIEAKNSF